MDEFDETGYYLSNGLLVATSEMAAEFEMALRVVRVARLANLAENFGEVVGNEAKVIRVGVVVGFLKFPAGDVGVDAVVEGCIHLLRHRVKQV